MYYDEEYHFTFPSREECQAELLRIKRQLVMILRRMDDGPARINTHGIFGYVISEEILDQMHEYLENMQEGNPHLCYSTSVVNHRLSIDVSMQGEEMALFTLSYPCFMENEEKSDHMWSKEGF